MAKVTAGLPQGTRDFGPEVVHKRSFILSTIRKVFEIFGFQPLETPAMENLETLMGKYGEEGDKLIFKILNNGLADPKNTDKARAAFEQVLNGKNDKNLTERALKYDLTIPFARYVAMNHAQLVMPFKRYQVQPVWRADRPQKGRYREFYQCDADVVGSRSLWNEIEFANLYATVFKQLQIPVEIRINSRKILAALAEQSGGSALLTDITTAIDKLDKIGLDKVSEELRQKQLSYEQVEQIQRYLAISGTNEQVIEQVTQLLGGTQGATEGIAELQTILAHSKIDEEENGIIIDLTLARGLNYYTGTIFEVKAKNVQMGSIGGGGRYDDLTGLFGVPNIPGVGISFGVDRIYDVMEELNLFPPTLQTATQVLFLNLGKQETEKAFSLLQQLRARNVRCELYPDEAKMDKQMKYADRKKIAYVVIIGSRELEAGNCVIKNLVSGEQQTVSEKELLNLHI